MESGKKSTKRKVNKTVDFVDLSNFEIERKEVAVNGLALPLSIGDRLLINEQDHFVKTIVSIQVHEDGRIGYMLEWFDSTDSSFKTEWVTGTELSFLNRAKFERKTVKAFCQED